MRAGIGTLIALSLASTVLAQSTLSSLVGTVKD